MTLAASVVFHCLPLLQDYKNFKNEKFDFNVTSINSSTNLDDQYPFTPEDFYNATSNRYAYKITADVRSACDDYTEFCGPLVFKQLDEETAFSTQSDIELAKENLVKITKKYIIEEEQKNARRAEEMARNKIEPCFSPLVLEMHKTMLECNSMYLAYYKSLQEKDEEKQSFLKGINLQDFAECYDYKSNVTVDNLDCDQIIDLDYLDQYPEEAETYFLKTNTKEAFNALFIQALSESRGTFTSKEFKICLEVNCFQIQNAMHVIIFNFRNWITKITGGNLNGS